MNKNKQVIIGVITVIALFFIWSLLGRDNEGQIANEIKKHWQVTNIEHIEIINGNKSVAFFTTVDGTEMEMYLEKSLFSWNKKIDFSFSPEGVDYPIFLSFFSSPYSNEEEYNAVLLRVFDKNIDSVKIVKGENIIHNFNVLSKGTGERFGLFITESDEIYDAEYIAYDREGEVVYISKSY